MLTRDYVYQNLRRKKISPKIVTASERVWDKGLKFAIF